MVTPDYLCVYVQMCMFLSTLRICGNGQSRKSPSLILFAQEFSVDTGCSVVYLDFGEYNIIFVSIEKRTYFFSLLGLCTVSKFRAVCCFETV